MSIEMLELQMVNLLQAIHQSKNGILSIEQTAEVVGAENVEPLRAKMEEQKFLMPPSGQNKGGFELTFAGLQAATESYIAEVLAGGEELSEKTLFEAMQRGKRRPEDDPPAPWTEEDPLRISAPEKSGAIAFLFPEDDRNFFVELVQAIPASWLWMNGQLRAPQDLVEARQASQHGGLRIRRYGRGELVSERDRRESGPYARILPSEEYDPMIAEVREDLLDILARHRLPGFIEFDEAGFDSAKSEVNLGSALQVATSYLERGYLGWLTFYSDCYDNRPWGPEEVTLHLEPWIENEMGIRTHRPAMIRILWKPRHGGGKYQNVAHLVELCRSERLDEVPVQIEPGNRW